MDGDISVPPDPHLKGNVWSDIPWSSSGSLTRSKSMLSYDLESFLAEQWKETIVEVDLI